MRSFLLLLSSGLLLTACPDDPATAPDLQEPVIEAVFLPASVYLADPEGVLVHVRVSDPQGVADIANVQLSYTAGNGASSQLSMRDDGLDGDIIVNDGQYVSRLRQDVLASAGMASVQATVTDNAGNSAVSDPFGIEILPGSPSAAPIVLLQTAPDTVWIDSTYQQQILAQVSDADSLADIERVSFRFFAPGGVTAITEGILLDDGNADDGVANNGIFGATLAFAFDCGTPGLYDLQVQATDRSGAESAVRNKTAVGVRSRGELPPRIVSVSAPDTLRKSNLSAFDLRVQVEDGNGLCDIRRVFFNSFRPDGTPAAGNPFALADDGRTQTLNDGTVIGDPVAGDGEYALILQFSSQNDNGTYRFEIQVEDQTGNISDKTIQEITLVQ